MQTHFVRHVKVYNLLLAILLFVTILFLVIRGLSNPIEDEAQLRGRPTYRQSGQLFVVEFIPGDRRINVLTAGKPVASLDAERVVILGKVIPKRAKARNLKIEWQNNYFEIVEPIVPESEIEIKVSEKLQPQNSETFRFEKGPANSPPK